MYRLHVLRNTERAFCGAIAHGRSNFMSFDSTEELLPFVESVNTMNDVRCEKCRQVAEEKIRQEGDEDGVFGLRAAKFLGEEGCG